MIKTYKTEAIILNRKNIGEADKLITIFSKHFGKRKVIAKGIRKINSRRSAHLEFFTQVAIFLHHGKNFDIITEVITLNAFTNLKKTIGRIAYAYIALELVDRLTAENQEHFYIYNQLVVFLNKLNDINFSSDQAKSALELFKKDILINLGFIDNGRKYLNNDIDNIINQIIEGNLSSPNLLTNLQKKI